MRRRGFYSSPNQVVKRSQGFMRLKTPLYDSKRIAIAAFSASSQVVDGKAEESLLARQQGTDRTADELAEGQVAA